MVKNSQRRTCLHFILAVCSGSMLIFQLTIPKTMAYRKDGGTSKMNEYLVQDQRTHMTKKNYMVQHGLEGDMLGDNFDLVYSGTPPDYDRKSEELQALIVDYANMRRNNIILLDNSVETRTRKRGNIKVGKISVPFNRCDTCEYEMDPHELDINHYPRVLAQTGCSTELCSSSYKCEATIYNHTVLKLKSSPNEPSEEPSEEELPEGLNRRWKAVVIPLPVACVCKSDYILPD